MSVAEGIRYRRTLLGLSQWELAERMGTTENVISRWETGRHRPTAGSMARLAEALSCSVAVLYGAPISQFGLAEQIRARREALGITQEQLAELVGISRITISQWERGKNKPWARHLPALAAVFDCSVGELLSD